MNLNAQHDEYYYQYHQKYGAGFQVVLYDYGTFPIVESSGFYVGVGSDVQIGVDIIEVVKGMLFFKV